MSLSSSSTTHTDTATKDVEEKMPDDLMGLFSVGSITHAAKCLRRNLASSETTEDKLTPPHSETVERICAAASVAMFEASTCHQTDYSCVKSAMEMGVQLSVDQPQQQQLVPPPPPPPQPQMQPSNQPSGDDTIPKAIYCTSGDGRYWAMHLLDTSSHAIDMIRKQKMIGDLTTMNGNTFVITIRGVTDDDFKRQPRSDQKRQRKVKGVGVGVQLLGAGPETSRPTKKKTKMGAPLALPPPPPPPQPQQQILPPPPQQILPPPPSPPPNMESYLMTSSGPMFSGFGGFQQDDMVVMQEGNAPMPLDCAESQGNMGFWLPTAPDPPQQPAAPVFGQQYVPAEPIIIGEQKKKATEGGHRHRKQKKNKVPEGFEEQYPMCIVLTEDQKNMAIERHQYLNLKAANQEITDYLRTFPGMELMTPYTASVQPVENVHACACFQTLYEFHGSRYVKSMKSIFNPQQHKTQKPIDQVSM